MESLFVAEMFEIRHQGDDAKQAGDDSKRDQREREHPPSIPLSAGKWNRVAVTSARDFPSSWCGHPPFNA